MEVEIRGEEAIQIIVDGRMNGGGKGTEKIRLENLWSEVRFYGTDSRF